MFGSIGTTEIAVVLLVLLVLFGPKQLPKIGRAWGEGLRELRNIGKAIEED